MELALGLLVLGIRPRPLLPLSKDSFGLWLMSSPPLESPHRQKLVTEVSHNKRLNNYTCTKNQQQKQNNHHHHQTMLQKPSPKM